jgi:hypothetical protein
MTKATNTNTNTALLAINPIDFERRAQEFHGFAFEWDTLAEQATETDAAEYRARATAARASADKCRATADKVRKAQARASVRDYWDGSASQSVADSIKAGRVVNVYL